MTLAMVLFAFGLPSVSRADLLLTHTGTEVSGGTPISATGDFSPSGRTYIENSMLLLAAGFDLTSIPSIDFLNSTPDCHKRCPTPEPSSLILFGLGVLAVAFLMRRRFMPIEYSDGGGTVS